MLTTFVILCQIYCIFVDFSGKVLEEKEREKGKVVRRKGKKANPFLLKIIQNIRDYLLNVFLIRAQINIF